MKTQITALILLSTITFSNVISAQEVALPKVIKPEALQEGIQRELTPAQIAELLPWAQNSDLFLKDLLESTQGISTTDKIDRLVAGIKEVVVESNQRNSELFMRYILNRALVIHETLVKESDSLAVGTPDAQVRVLLMSINMARKYYNIDLQILSKKTVAPFKAFGLEYFEFLNDLNKSIFDASAQYHIQRTALEWLQWDLYRDLNNKAFAPQINKINNNLKIFTTNKMSDAQSIAFIRRMKQVTAGMEFGDGTKIGGATGATGIEQSQRVFGENTGTKSDNVIRVNDRILLNGSLAGVAKEVFSDGNVSAILDVNSSRTTHHISDLGKGVNCFKTFCVGNRVVLNGARAGKIEEVFNNSYARVLLDTNSSATVHPLDDLGKGVSGGQCGQSVCEGNRVLLNGSRPGVVKEVFANGYARVLLDTNRSTTMHSQSDLSVSR